MKRGAVFLALLLLFASSCGERPEKPKNTYPHTAPATPVALVVAEWNGRPHILASAFLVEREKGAFLTAKHFTDDLEALGGDTCRLFFNGKVFTARIAKLPPLRDAALLQISGDFDPASFPEPYKVSALEPRIGEKVFVLGLHPHPFWIREQNLKGGHGDTVIPILKNYYGMIEFDKNREMEIVSDRLEASVIEIQTKIKFGDEEDAWTELRNSANSYIRARTKLNHKFSFGGLSGGAVTNAAGELIGLITAEDPARLEFDENGRLEGIDFSIQIVFDTLYITPIEDLKDLYLYIQKL